jgi:CheY-like chemotaxis protein
MAQFARLTPATILIVESEVLVRQELVDQLSALGLAVVAAADADGAITLLDSHPEIELMLTDIRMSGSMDGVKLAHHVRHRWPPVRIIVASGLATALEDLPRGSVFLAKPFRPEALAEAVERLTAPPSSSWLHN